ncbi:9371_t:CDS:2, partial [Racocetra persica]
MPKTTTKQNEYLEVIKILRNIQKDQASQIEEIKNRIITTGINISLKNYNDLETKFKDENIEEVEEIEDRNYCKQYKRKLYSKEDFDNNDDIITESTT